MGRPSRHSPEVRERAVRMVQEHGAEHASQWAAIASIADKLGCSTETLRRWVRQAERDAGQRPGLEVIRLKGPWRHLEAVEFATLEWVDWFNQRRLLGPIGDLPPAEYEARYYEQAAVA